MNTYVKELEDVEGDDQFEDILDVWILGAIHGNISALTKALWIATVGEKIGIKDSKKIKEAAENILKKYKDRELKDIGIIEVPYLEKFEPRAHEGTGSEQLPDALEEFFQKIIVVEKVGLVSLNKVQRLVKARVLSTTL